MNFNKNFLYKKLHIDSKPIVRTTKPRKVEYKVQTQGLSYIFYFILLQNKSNNFLLDTWLNF